jgi:hypothetical protein
VAKLVGKRRKHTDEDGAIVYRQARRIALEASSRSGSLRTTADAGDRVKVLLTEQGTPERGFE